MGSSRLNSRTAADLIETLAGTFRQLIALLRFRLTESAFQGAGTDYELSNAISRTGSAEY